METSTNSRIKEIMSYFQLNAASFADKIGIQRSALSHILSGRNKASLDVIQKIIVNFPGIDVYWLLVGTGEMLSSANYTQSADKKEISTGQEVVDSHLSPINQGQKQDLFYKKEVEKEDSTIAPLPPILSEIKNSRKEKEIEMITILYSNHTFTVYHKNDPSFIPPKETV